MNETLQGVKPHDTSLGPSPILIRSGVPAEVFRHLYMAFPNDSDLGRFTDLGEV